MTIINLMSVMRSAVVLFSLITSFPTFTATFTAAAAAAASDIVSASPSASIADPVLEQALERTILISLYQYTNGDSWTKNDNWNDPKVHICDWHGIHCINPESTSRRRFLLAKDMMITDGNYNNIVNTNTNYINSNINTNTDTNSNSNSNRKLDDADETSRSVESIDLSENNMKGSVPISLLLLLPNIRSIRLNGNNVDYTKVAQQEQEVLDQVLALPDQTIVLSSAIQHLDVSHTSVKQITRLFQTGGQTTIAMPRLTTFYASQCQLRGPFPSFLFDHMTALERLALDHNSLTGTIPPSLGGLHKLKYLSLAANELTGSIPRETNALIRLRYLLLQSNRLTGTIPVGLTSAEYTPLLEQLDLSDQRDRSATATAATATAGLSGTIPAFDTQKFLRRVDLQVNSLAGTIPATLLSETENFNDFDFIILASNLLTGSVPASVITNRIPIDGLFLDDNKITDLTNCPFSDYGCSSIMCPPLTYEPRSGRQEEDNRPCLACPQNTKYWGQTVCQQQQDDEGDEPTTPPTRSPQSGPTTEIPTAIFPLPTLEPIVATTASPSNTMGDPINPAHEKGILLELYVAAGGDNWLSSDGWNAPDNNGASFCDWHGIVCVSEDVPSVKFLNLDNNNLLGELPESIYTLPNLRALDLSQNDGLTVTFQDIGLALSLEALDLSKTIIISMEGILDAAPRLQELHMNDVGAFENKRFPTEFYQLTALRQLSIDYNQASGSLPSDFGNLSNLVIFSASNNQLTGSIPSSISSMTDLATLRLSTNHFSGLLPEQMERMRSLSLLDLSNQWSNGVDDDFADNGKPGFHGPLPEFAKLSQLRRLDLGVNSFSGTVPENFLQGVDPENLFEFADLGDNFLTGTVPAGVKRLPNLYLQDNFIDGIDQDVCDNVSPQLIPFGCDAVLCQPGTFNQDGRQISDAEPCVACTTVGAARHYGSTSCAIDIMAPTPVPVNQQPSSGGNIADSPERTALELIYTECGGQGWAARDNWMNKAVSICLWNGIRCDADGVVAAITLRSNNLEGIFPSLEVFENIPSLTTLVLDGNIVKFTFEGIDRADNLETLDLTHTELADVSGIDVAPNIKNLYLASNNLKGDFPSEILGLTSLSRLALAFNDLTGPIPDGVAALANLEFLSLHDNELTGTIPPAIAQLNKLAFLLLQSNSFEGSIPTVLNFLGDLGFFSVSGQRGDGGKGLSGRIPSFATLSNLKKMDLSSNQLTGTIPADFLDKAAAQSFEHLSLAHNRLTGEIPSLFAKFPAEHYDITDNEISELGDGICNGASLSNVVEIFGCNAILCPPGSWNSKGRQLDENDECDACLENKFFGSSSCDDGSGSPPPTRPPITRTDLTDVEILSKLFDDTKGSSWKRSDHWKQASMSVCEWFGIRCAKEGNNRIEHIVLSANNMAGTVPKEIFLLPYLKTLVLDSNNIEVSLSDIGSARLLEVLDISATSVNDLTGIGAASQLRELHLKQIGLTGTFPLEIFLMTSLEQIDFDFNSFSGPLEHSIGQLSNLKQFSGEKNKLSGVVPDQLRELTNLVTLRLGKNSFAGNIPADALNQMTSLAYIDLSSQDEHGGKGFSGELPPLDKLRRLTQIRFKHNSFSGTVPFNFLDQVNPEEFQYADVSSNSLTGTLPISLAQIGDIYMQDNMISGVPQEFCDEVRGVEYTQFGCDAFLCKPGTYNRHGRQESKDSGCDDCPEAIYFGSVECGADSQQPAAAPTTPAPPMVERDVLVKLYQTCGGDNWDESDNWLTPESFCTWAGIQCVDGTAATVEAIELGANNLHGTPPIELYYLPNLKVLSLYSNPLKGVDFDGIQYANKMTELLLDATGISSIDGIEKAPRLEILNLRFNAFVGSMPSQLTDLTNLHTLTMAYNALTGSLPSAIEEMTNLKALLLSHNELSGNLHSVNFPSSIRRLDLSNNELTGSIPDSFLTLVSFNAELEIDLASNHLTGAIPTDLTRFTHFDIYLKDNKITELNNQLCSMSDWNEGDVGRYGCNGILCPKGHFSPSGRHSSSGECQQCAPGRALAHLGSSNCDDISKASAMQARTALIIAAGGLLFMAMDGYLN